MDYQSFICNLYHLFEYPNLNHAHLLLQGDVNDSLSRRRSSYNIEIVRAPKGGGSASKVSILSTTLAWNYTYELFFSTLQVDLLKSALEINHKVSNTHLRKDGKNSDQSLDSKRSDSAPRLNPLKNISQPALSAVADEVSTYFVVLLIILFT